MASLQHDFSVLLLTPLYYHQRLAATFHFAAAKFIESTAGRCDKIQINMASSVDQLMEYADTIDFVAYFVNTKDFQPEATLRHQLSQISGGIAATRLIVVNASCRSGPFWAASKLVEIADEFQIPTMNSEVEDKDSCRRTAEKIIALAAKVSGFQFGYPVIIPTVGDFGKNLGT